MIAQTELGTSWLGWLLTERPEERECVLPVEMEHLLCAPDGEPSAQTRDKETGGGGRLADGWPEANAPLIFLLFV